MFTPIMLTAAEAAVVTLLFDGMDASQIAATRGTSRETVKVQLRMVYRKAHVGSALALVALAFKQGGFLC